MTLINDIRSIGSKASEIYENLSSVQSELKEINLISEAAFLYTSEDFESIQHSVEFYRNELSKIINNANHAMNKLDE